MVGGYAVSHPFQYVTLRCVPRVDREEFVNVGIVLYSQSADVLTAAWHLDAARLRALDPGLDVDALRGALETVAAICAGASGGGLPVLTSLGRRFGWLSAPRSTVLQPGPLHGGQCAHPELEVERLMRRLVLVDAG